MVGLGVNQRVDHATEWCAPVVITRKKNNTLRICVDHGELNSQTVSEQVIMPTVEGNLAKVAGAKGFGKIGANAGTGKFRLQWRQEN